MCFGGACKVGEGMKEMDLSPLQFKTADVMDEMRVQIEMRHLELGCQ